MSLILSSLIISWAIALFTLLPWFFEGIRNYSRIMQYSGALVLFGFCFFDLIPEMFELGGSTSLLLMAIAWGIFAVIHRFQSNAHGHAHDEAGQHEQHVHDHGAGFLVGAMAVHCFAGGMFLVSSFEISTRLAMHVFWGLLLHKGFEAVSMSSVLMEKLSSRRQLYLYTSIYALSFPAGVLLTVGLHKVFAGSLQPSDIEQIGMVISSLAVGSLLGCLVQDYAIPMVRQLRRTTALRAS